MGAGGTYPRNDFVCMLNCDMGPDAGRNTTRAPNVTLPAASIFNPPYPINSGNMQVRFSRAAGPLVSWPAVGQSDVHRFACCSSAGTQTLAELLTGHFEFLGASVASRLLTLTSSLC